MPKTMPVTGVGHKYQPVKFIVPNGTQTGFKVTSESLPKVTVECPIVSIGNKLGLPIIRIDLIEVVWLKVTFQN
jgi:hypothetical protein